MLLNELIKEIDIVEVFNFNENIDIKEIHYNSKNVVKGSLFVAIKGYKVDGHKFLKDAIEKGAVAIVVNEYQPEFSIPQIQVNDSRTVLSKLSAKLEGNPSKKIKVVGVTATNGKTSTSTLLNTILEENKYKTALLGTVVNKIADSYEKAIMTTPESKDLQKMFSKMVSCNVDVCTMEVSSAAQELKRVNDVDFDIVVMNNISKEHLEQHGTFEEYFKHKQKLVTQAKKEAISILNIDDESIKTLVSKTESKVITYSMNDENATIYCNEFNIQAKEPTFTITVNPQATQIIETLIPQTVQFSIRLQGFHSIMNALSTVIVAMVLGIDNTTIQNGLSNFHGVERRFQRIYNENFEIYDDHFANEGNVIATMRSISLMKYNKLTIVLAIRGSRGKEVNQDVLDAMLSWKNELNIERLIITSYSDFDIINNEVKENEKEFVLEYLNRNNISYEYIETLKSAIEKAVDLVDDKDIVLLAGCQGMDNGAKVLQEVLLNKKIIDKNHELNSIVNMRIAGE